MAERHLDHARGGRDRGIERRPGPPRRSRSAHVGPYRGGDRAPVGQQRVLRRVGDRDAGHVRHRHPQGRGHQVVEGRFADQGGDLRAEAHRERVLVDDAQPAGAADRSQDGRAIERKQRPQVEHLRLHPLGGELVRGRQALLQHQAVGDQRDRVARASHAGAPGPLTLR